MRKQHSLALDYVLLALASVEEGDLEGAMDSLQDAVEAPDYDETVEELDASNDDAFEEDSEEETCEYDDDSYEDEDEESDDEEETLAAVLASIEDEESEEDEFLDDPYGENVETSSVRRAGRAAARVTRRETSSYRSSDRARDNLRRLRRG